MFASFRANILLPKSEMVVWLHYTTLCVLNSIKPFQSPWSADRLSEYDPIIRKFVFAVRLVTLTMEAVYFCPLQLRHHLIVKGKVRIAVVYLYTRVLTSLVGCFYHSLPSHYCTTSIRIC